MMEIRYVNNRGDVLNLYGDGIVCDPTGPIAWNLSPKEVNGKVASFQTGVTSKKMTAATYSMEARERLYEVPSFDIADMSPGKLYVGEWYVFCYLTASELGSWWRTDGHATYELTVTVEDAHWRRDTEYSYTQIPQEISGLDFEFDYEHDYGYAYQRMIVTNQNHLEADVLIRIYGETTAPTVRIGQNDYKLSSKLNPDDYVEISTYDKTVRIVRATGEVDNGFQDILGDYMEGSGSYVFQKIPSGSSEVSWDGSFDFDVIVSEMRYEPRWS